jgi:hypothetical protein
MSTAELKGGAPLFTTSDMMSTYNKLFWKNRLLKSR